MWVLDALADNSLAPTKLTFWYKKKDHKSVSNAKLSEEVEIERTGGATLKRVIWKTSG